MRRIRVVVLGMLGFAGGMAAWETQVSAGAPCTSVRVQGCGRKARVCVATGSTSDAERRALEAFRNAYKCASPSVGSYSSSCSEAANDKCDLRN